MVKTRAGGQCVGVGDLSIAYNHPHDLLGILEVFVLDVYSCTSLREDDIVLDIGTGVGDFALAASRRIGKSGLVIALEPSPEDFRALTKNLQSNSVKNVVPFRCAIGPDGGQVTIEFKGNRFTAPTRTFDGIMAEAFVKTSAPARGLTFVKMDVEGAEATVLRDLAAFLTGVRAIAIELHGTAEEVDAFLKPRGFAFARLGRADYLLSSARFTLRHPTQAVTFWRKLGESGYRPGLSKILRGIDISRGDELLVGRYVRKAAD
jgi:FkbM family methyltransferase